MSRIFSKLYHLSFCLLLQAILCAFAQANNFPIRSIRCIEAALENLYRDPDLTEADLLASLTGTNINSDFAKMLNGGGDVFEVKDLQGHSYVVRVEDEGSQSLDHERFSAEFARQVPGVAVAATKLASAEDAGSLLRIYERLEPRGYGEIRRIAYRSRKSPDELRLSVTVLLPGESGKKTLERLTLPDRMRRLLDEISNPENGPGRGARRVFMELRTQLNREWTHYPEDLRASLIQDIKERFPSARNRPDEAVFNYLQKYIRKFSASGPHDFEIRRLRRIDPAFLTQLANHWIVYTVLGIPDFHPKNWLMHDGRVMGIDLAHPPMGRVGYTPLHLELQQHPLGYGNFSEDIRNLLLGSVSPEVRTYFQDLTPAAVRDIAARSDYELGLVELNSIMNRVRYFVDLVPPARR